MSHARMELQSLFPLGAKVREKHGALPAGYVCGWTSNGRVVLERSAVFGTVNVLAVAPHELDVLS